MRCVARRGSSTSSSTCARARRPSALHVARRARADERDGRSSSRRARARLPDPRRRQRGALPDVGVPRARGGRGVRCDDPAFGIAWPGAGRRRLGARSRLAGLPARALSSATPPATLARRHSSHPAPEHRRRARTAKGGHHASRSAHLASPPRHARDARRRAGSSPRPPLAQTAEFILEPVGPTGFDVDLDSPTFTLKVRLLGAPGQPIAGTGVDWTVTRGTGRVTPTAASSVTNSLGETTATFTATARRDDRDPRGRRAGLEHGRLPARGGLARAAAAAGARRAGGRQPRAGDGEPGRAGARRPPHLPGPGLRPERRSARRRRADLDGRGVARLAARGRLDHAVGQRRLRDRHLRLRVAGRTILAASYPGVTPVRWQVDTGSLGTLTPGNQSYRHRRAPPSTPSAPRSSRRRPPSRRRSASS